MRIVNQSILAQFRTPGRCEWCRTACTAREPAHLFSRGAGRLDIAVNLVALGSTLAYQCPCHSDHHSGREPNRNDLLAIVAQRENVLQDDIVAAVHFLRAAPKDVTEREFRELVLRFHLRPTCIELVKRTLG